MPDERSGPVAAIVLAAGVSSRMGRNKLFLEIDGESLLRRAVRCAVSAGLDPVIVVLGHEADRAQEEIAGLPCRAVLNRDHASGMHTSFRSGIGAVPDDARAAVVILPDMPRVSSDMVAALVSRYRASDAPLVISEYGGVHAPPTLYDRSLFEEIRGMEGDGCGKQVVRRHRGEAEALSWPEARMADLDQPEDVDAWRASGAPGERCAQTS